MWSDWSSASSFIAFFPPDCHPLLFQVRDISTHFRCLRNNYAKLFPTWCWSNSMAELDFDGSSGFLAAVILLLPCPWVVVILLLIVVVIVFGGGGGGGRNWSPLPQVDAEEIAELAGIAEIASVCLLIAVRLSVLSLSDEAEIKKIKQWKYVTNQKWLVSEVLKRLLGASHFPTFLLCRLCYFA